VCRMCPFIFSRLSRKVAQLLPPLVDTFTSAPLTTSPSQHAPGNSFAMHPSIRMSCNALNFSKHFFSRNDSQLYAFAPVDAFVVITEQLCISKRYVYLPFTKKHGRVQEDVLPVKKTPATWPGDVDATSKQRREDLPSDDRILHDRFYFVRCNTTVPHA
jgi:hypothetical protein